MRKFLSRAFMNVALIGSALGLTGAAASAQSPGWESGRPLPKVALVVNAASFNSNTKTSWFDGGGLQFRSTTNSYATVGFANKSLYLGYGGETGSYEKTLAFGAEAGIKVSDAGLSFYGTPSAVLGQRGQLNAKFSFVSLNKNGLPLASLQLRHTAGTAFENSQTMLPSAFKIR